MKTKLEGFFSVSFSKPFICGSLVQLFKRYYLTWVLWQHYDLFTAQIPLQGRTCSSFAGSTVSRQPAAVNPLWELPQLQGTTQPRSHPFMGCPYPMTHQCKITKLFSCPSQGNSEGHSDSRALHDVGQGCCWTCITSQLFLLPIPVSSPLSTNIGPKHSSK